MRNSIQYSKMMTIEPNGHISAANITEFQEELIEAVTNEDYTVFLVDMTKVEFVDSAGLMALASAFRLAESLGKGLSICSIPPSVKIIFELTQLDRVLKIYDSSEAFKVSLNQRQEIAA